MVYRFGEFALDRDTRQLLAGGSEVHLPPKAFELLVLLLVNRPRAMSKVELQEHLWPSTFVEETNLASLVVEVRRALRDSASRPAFVRTVYGFGYRFIGDVIEDGGPSSSGSTHIRPCLVLENRTLILMEGASILGRAPDAAIPIDLRGISRHHARIVVSQGTATLEDLGSKNGTRLNGNRIAAPVRLTDGDEIRLGTVTLTFRMTLSASPTETVTRSE